MRKKRFFNLVFLMCIGFFGFVTNANGVTTQKKQKTTAISKTFNWDKVINAIIQVESEGNPKAVSKNGSSVGILQITPVLVEEVNKCLKANGVNKKYTTKDRYDVKKSKEMFIIIQNYHNKQNNIEFAIKSWNCGVYYKTKPHLTTKANIYYRKVMEVYRKK